MGLDVPDVSLVVTIGVPSTDWVAKQQAGRAGRDGRQAVAVLLASKVRVSRPGGELSAQPCHIVPLFQP
jgi:superfamily II DNA helicase RecQ